MTDKNAAIEHTKTLIAEATARIAADRAALAQLEDQLAGLLAEFKGGDRVLYRGVEFEITSYKLQGTSRNPQARYFGAPIKKDGTPSMRVSELWDTSKITRKEG